MKTDGNASVEPLLPWLVVILVLAVFAPQVSAPLELQDDHRIVTGASRAASVGGGVYGLFDAMRLWWRVVRVEDPSVMGRFRPVNQVGDVILVSLLGGRALPWRILLFLATGATAALLFRLGRAFFSSPWAAAVFSLGVMLSPSPGPSSAWYRLGPKEWMGLLLLCSGVVLQLEPADARSRPRRVVGLGLCVLGGASKESFVVALPAVGLALVLAEVQRTGATWIVAARSRRASLGVLAGAFILFTGSIAGALVSAGAASYGARGIGGGLGRLLSSIGRDLWLAPQLSWWFIPAAAGVGLVIAQRDVGRDAKRFAGAAVFAATLCAPEFVLHAPRGGMWDHYWIPCVVGMAAVNAAGVACSCCASAGHALALRRVVFAMGVLWLANALRIDVASVLNFRNMAEAQQEAVGFIAGRLPADGVVLVAGAWETEQERGWAVAKLLESKGAQPRSVLFLDTVSGKILARAHREEPLAFWWTGPKEEDGAAVVRGANAVFCLGVDAEEVLAKAVMKDSGPWERRGVTVPQTHLSLRRLSLTRTDGHIDLLLRPPAKSVRPSAETS